MPITEPTPEEDDIVCQMQSQSLDDVRRKQEAMIAARRVADIVRSTLGPKCMNRELLDGIKVELPKIIPLREDSSLTDSNADLIDENGALTLTLEDGGDALDCNVCYLPLRPPIFQCMEGHVLCSMCREKLIDATTGTGQCHICGEEIDSDDIRCLAMERVVESIRVPCPNASHGCAAKMTYYNRSDHRWACPHARYNCPSHGCGFVGSAGALLDHVASVHSDKEAMHQFWGEEVSSFMSTLRVHMVAANNRASSSS